MQIFNTVSFIDKLSFTKHLSVMIKSGITITDAVDTLIPDTNGVRFKMILQSILKDLENGQPLSKALARFPDAFDQLYVNLVRVGEESGNLDENLIYLSHKLTKENTLRKKIKNIMLYPSMVIIIAGTVGAYISIFVLPQLVSFFDSLEAQLPLSTQILLGFATIMKSYGILIISGVLILLAFFRYLIHTPMGQPIWHQIILKIPGLGKFLQNAQMAALCRNMGVMLQSGLSITTALEVEEQAADNLVFKSYIKKMYSAVLRGKGMSAVMGTHDLAYIPPIAVKMIAVGEKTGKLDESLLYLGDFFEEEVDSSAKNFSTMLEPVIFIVIGATVAFLAFAIITPIYQLTGSIGGR